MMWVKVCSRAKSKLTLRRSVYGSVSYTHLEYEAELGQLIKTALLWLEDDLEQRYGTRLLEVSPQNLLTEGYIQDVYKRQHLFRAVGLCKPSI